MAEHRQNRSEGEEQPDQQTREQQPLPASAEIDIFVTLVAPKECGAVGKLILDAQPFASERPDDNQEQRAEENVNSELLIFRFIAADQRGDEESSRQPGRGDPRKYPVARARCG